MTVMQAPTYRQSEFHPFAAADHDFIYLVSAGAVFEIDDAVRSVLARLEGQELTHAALVKELMEQGQSQAEAEELVRELRNSQLIHLGHALPVSTPEAPPANFPLQALVLNVTNQCNLACTYCYEFGADKIATPQASQNI